MCTTGCLIFGKNWLNIQAEKVTGGNVLEVGSRNVNGSLREFAEKLNPKSFLGIDITDGPGVDKLINVYDLSKLFDSHYFDVIICTEVLEHIRDWKKAIREMFVVLKPEGLIIMTTRSPGFEKHDWPSDYWRFTKDDMYNIFAGFSVLEIADDRENGVLFAGIKTKIFPEDLSGILVYEVE